MTTSVSDWIKLLVKFKGRCNKCKKEIKPGDYAFWSRDLKAIQHITCHNSQNHVSSNAHLDKKQVKCYLCDKFDDLSHQKKGDLMYDFSYSIFICASCMDSPDSFSLYKSKFLKKLEKTVKLKSI
ncbi:MAG: hypothetical protein ACPKQO_08335 [Nitrososphaeraceae archaeon]